MPNRLGYPSRNPEFKSNRIVGGTNDKPGAHKYQISLQLWGYDKDGNGPQWLHTCGGSVISSTRILTAAHCVDTYGASSYRAVAGEFDLKKVESTEQTSTVSKFVIHPSWDRPNLNYDVAVIRLGKSLSLNNNVAKVTLATSDPKDGDESIVTGWGYKNYHTQEQATTILQMLTTERESDYWAGRDSSIYDARTQIATYDSNQGICMGDSGGPLVLSNLVQYGVCSYVLTPCGSAKSDFYARVSFFRSWILAQ